MWGLHIALPAREVAYLHAERHRAQLSHLLPHVRRRARLAATAAQAGSSRHLPGEPMTSEYTSNIKENISRESCFLDVKGLDGKKSEMAVKFYRVYVQTSMYFM